MKKELSFELCIQKQEDKENHKIPITASVK